MIKQKIKLDFAPSVNLGPIIVDIITKNKIDVPFGTKLAMPAFHTQVIFISSLFDIPFCTLLPILILIGPHRFLATLFENSYSLAFKLVLQNHFHS